MTNSNWKPVPHSRAKTVTAISGQSWQVSACEYLRTGAECNCDGTRWHGYGERVGDFAAVWALTGWLAGLKPEQRPFGFLHVYPEGYDFTLESPDYDDPEAIVRPLYAAPVQPAAAPTIDVEQLKEQASAWESVVDALMQHAPPGWLNKRKRGVDCAVDAIAGLSNAAVKASAVAVPDGDLIEKIVEYGGHRENEGGSYATFQKSEARQHRSEADEVLAEISAILATRQPSAQAPDDVDLWAFCRDVLKRGAAIESQFSQQGYETFIAEIEHAARKEDKRLRAMLSAAARKGAV